MRRNGDSLLRKQKNDLLKFSSSLQCSERHEWYTSNFESETTENDWCQTKTKKQSVDNKV